MVKILKNDIEECFMKQMCKYKKENKGICYRNNSNWCKFKMSDMQKNQNRIYTKLISISLYMILFKVRTEVMCTYQWWIGNILQRLEASMKPASNGPGTVQGKGKGKIWITPLNINYY